MTQEIPQGLRRFSGVILKRERSAEGDASLYLFLKGIGTAWVSVPGAARGSVRFGGSIEPLVWGNFNLYKGTRRFYLKSVDVKEDFWELRTSPWRLRTLLEWDMLLCEHIVPGIPCDEILALFYWCGILLKQGVHPGAGEWRFLWKWLENWGLAPSLEICVDCGSRFGEGAFWTERGLQCRSCGRTGAFLPERDLLLLRLAAETPFSRMPELFTGSGEDLDSPWKDAVRRLKRLFEYAG